MGDLLRSTAEPEPIGDVIADVFACGKFGKSAVVAELWGQWKEITGEDIAQHCFPEKISGRKLYIKVDSPIWRQQLDLIKEELKDRIDRKLHNVKIEKIILK